MTGSQPPPHIVCVDCGGTCHLIEYLPPDVTLTEPTILAYRCEDCRDRWDVEWEPDE